MMPMVMARSESLSDILVRPLIQRGYRVLLPTTPCKDLS